MKSQRCNVKTVFSLLFIISAMILGSCQTKTHGNVPSKTAEAVEAIDIAETEVEDTVIPSETPTPTPTITPTTPADERLIVNVNKDIDGNGVNDAIQIISLNDGTETHMKIYLNEKQIFEYEDPIFRMYGIDAFESLDLDGDNKNELFITVSTDANGRPYTIVLCLKQSDGKWNRMDYPKEDDYINKFPFKITRGKNEFDFIISSEDTNQVIHFDASSYYIDDGTDNTYTIKAYRENHYKEGDEVGVISAHGIWEAKTGTYNGRNCIIAVQGIETRYEYVLGEINIYFTYTKKGNIEILDVDYVPEK